MVERRDLISVAHYGWRGWLAQRVTAVIMLLYTLFLGGVLVSLPQIDFERWRALWNLTTVRYATIFFVLSALLHAWVGVRNIFMDYVKDTALRLFLYVLVIVTLTVYFIWAWQILWGM